MNNKFEVFDEVLIRKNGVVKTVVEVIESNRKKLNVDGTIPHIHRIQYLLDGYMATFHNEDELEYYGMKPIRSEEIDKFIIDMNLAQRNFDFLRRFTNKEVKHTSGYCPKCGGNLHDVYFGQIDALRCIDCEVIITK